MSSRATDQTDPRPVDDEQADRYGELNIGDEEFVVYDRENHQAWVQSTLAVGVDELR